MNKSRCNINESRYISILYSCAEGPLKTRRIKAKRRWRLPFLQKNPFMCNSFIYRTQNLCNLNTEKVSFAWIKN